MTGLNYANQTGLVGEPMSLEAMAATMGGAISYAVSRGMAKKGN